MLFRTAFLIVAGGVILHVAVLPICIVLIGYLAFSSLDTWLVLKRRQVVLEYETTGWVADPKEPTFEGKGTLSRTKLPNNDQIVVTRVAELLTKIR
jgi:hypothetical protein